MREELLALAERVEKAEGPDRDLFIEVAKVKPEAFTIAPDAWPHPDGTMWWANGKSWGRIPDFFASIDTAMLLVPANHMACVTNTGGLKNNDEHPIPGKGGALIAPLADLKACIPVDAATPALALTAAALRARAEAQP